MKDLNMPAAAGLWQGDIRAKRAARIARKRRNAVERKFWRAMRARVRAVEDELAAEAACEAATACFLAPVTAEAALAR
jgi:hypothetical protein